MADVEPALPTGSVRVTYDVDRAAIAQQVVELWVIGEFVDPSEIDQQEPTRILSRGIQAVEIHRLQAIVGAHANQVALVTHHIDQLELLEEGSDRVKSFADLWPRLDGDAQRRRVVEDETHERVPDQPLAPVGHVEIKGTQVRELHLALLIAHREIIPGSVVEVADTGKANAVAIDEGPRHHRDLRAPRTIVRGSDGDPPHNHAEKERNHHHGHAPLTRQPASPDRKRGKDPRQSQT